MGNFFVKGENIGKISKGEAIISALIPIFGQLYLRIFNFKGSLDKMWLLIPPLSVPPFSFIVSLMMYFGLVKDGEGGKPYDYFMLIPIITSFLLGVIKNKILPVVQMVGMIVTSLIAFGLREHKMCKNNTQTSNWDTIKEHSAKIISNSLITYALSILIPKIMKLVPFINAPMLLLEALPLASTVISVIFYILIYIIINMINGKYLDKYCSGNLSKSAKIGSILSLIYVIFEIMLASVIEHL